jgi:hypothetical protein
LLPISASGLRERSVFCFDLGDFEGRFFAFTEARTTFFEAGFLAETLRAGRGLRAADFFAELFFFFDLAIT